MITEDLIHYIEGESRRGVTNDAIQNALIGAGWKPMEVADAFRLVAERSHKGETGKSFTTDAGASEKKPPTAKANIPEPVITEEPASMSAKITSDSKHTAISKTALSSTHLPEFSALSVGDNKREHHVLIPALVVFALIVIGFTGYYFLPSLLHSPSRQVSGTTSIIERAKSINYSGSYTITAPAGMILPDRVLIRSFGGVVNRDKQATLSGTFFGIDDWFDYRARKNEAKFTAHVALGAGKPVDFSATSRLIGESLYVKLPESGALFDAYAGSAGANWVRYDSGDTVPTYAYGFFGNTHLYQYGFARELATMIGNAKVGEVKDLATQDTEISVMYPKEIVSYFASILAGEDIIGQSKNIGSRYTLLTTTDGPSGTILFDSAQKIKKAVISFGYTTKEFTTPVHVSFTLSFDRFNTLPDINIPILVTSLADIKATAALSSVPQNLRDFFTDIRTVAGVYKGFNDGSYKDVCTKEGENSETSTELTIPYVSEKIAAGGFANLICRDTETAWMLYTRDDKGLYCTDSRAFSGKVDREPVGEKCN